MNSCTPDNAFENSNSIAVSIRIRTPCEPLISPRLRHEVRHSSRLTDHWRWEKNTLYFGEGESGHVGSFDNIFPPESHNGIVYNDFASPLPRAVLAGYNATICAYGQTNSGKTFTMCGTKEDLGIFPRAADDLLRAIHDDPLLEGLLRVSITEIYNESLRDLLLEKKTDTYGLPSSEPSLFLTEDPTRGTIIANAREIYIEDMDKVMDLLCIAKRNRVTEKNSAHINASRSHMIFHLIYEGQVEGQDGVRISTLRIIDMAGSEVPINFDDASFFDAEGNEKSTNIACTGSNVVRKREDETRSSEGACIRKSLLALVRCVELVRTNQSTARMEALRLHYRDSKLTRLLRDTLEGSTLTAILCNINPNEQRETLATLRFALCAQGVHIHPTKLSVSPKSSSAQLGNRKLSQERNHCGGAHVEMGNCDWANHPMGFHQMRSQAKFRSASPTPTVLKMIESENTKSVKEIFSDHLLGRIKARLPHDWLATMKEKQEQLEDVLSAVCHARKLLIENRRELDAQSERVSQLECQVTELENDVNQLSAQRASCEQILEKCKLENAGENDFYLRKCTKYLHILDNENNSNRWQMFKSSPLHILKPSRRRSHVDPIRIAELRSQLSELANVFEYQSNV
ncbi:kinesin family protein (KipA) [Perkinsela sp. CCAP 1560/4]|nr:kinesin family protein (KipA) [Perkinsela sp. CCAP 1560/4]|eukprot:KNH06680.1 kinesin family protein (KipA) [Perkinsela sp. CCAP 1560/4]